MRYCAIPGCTVSLTVRRHHLCGAHYHEYGKLRPVPAWLRYLINTAEREQYFVEKHAWRFVSLDKVLAADEEYQADNPAAQKMLPLLQKVTEKTCAP